MINFYFLFVGVFFFYGKLFSSKLSEQVFKNQYIEVNILLIKKFIISYHGFITYILWTIGFLFFVISLKHGYYRY
jgi:phosphatidate cytidylyltransferase